MWSPLIPENQSRNFQPGLQNKNIEATETECVAHATQPGTHGTKPGGLWPWYFHCPLFDSQIHVNPYNLWVGWWNAYCELCRHYIPQFVTNPTHKDMHFYSSVSAIILPFSSVFIAIGQLSRWLIYWDISYPKKAKRGMKRGLLSLFKLRNQIFIILLRFYLVALRNPA